MPVVVAAAEDLGHGENDGDLGIVDLGSLTGGDTDRVVLRWNEFKGYWLGDPQPSIQWRPGWILQQSGIVPDVWRYLSDPKGATGLTGRHDSGWNPVALRHADASFAAGLVLQEKIVSDYWTWDNVAPYELATVWYPFDVNDDISGMSVPDDYIGCVAEATPTRRIFASTGWVDSLITDTGGKKNLLPHLYVRYSVVSAGGDSCEYVKASNRWVFQPD
jgi:hypothetical protein